MPPKKRELPAGNVAPHIDFIDALELLVNSRPQTAEFAKGDERALRRVRGTLENSVGKLQQYHRQLDPVVEPTSTFHPGSYQSVAALIVSALLNDSRKPLGQIRPYYGSGIYSLYYHGSHPAYALISGTDIPIYAGAASPKNFKALTPREQADALYIRQKDHADSIREAAAYTPPSLQLEDFTCRHLVVESGWEIAAESYLIKHYQPVWNRETKVCQGLGKHGDKSTTRQNARSRWDTLHPGRAWATEERNKPNKLSKDEIIREIWRHCLREYARADLNASAIEEIERELSKESTPLRTQRARVPSTRRGPVAE